MVQIKAYHFKASFNLNAVFQGGLFDHMIKHFESTQKDGDIFEMYEELLWLMFGNVHGYLFKHFIDYNGVRCVSQLYALKLEIWYHNGKHIEIPFDLCLLDIMFSEKERYFSCGGNMVDALRITEKDVHKLEQMRRDFININVSRIFRKALLY